MTAEKKAYIKNQLFVVDMTNVLFLQMTEKNMYNRRLATHFFGLKEKEKALWSPTFYFFPLSGVFSSISDDSKCNQTSDWFENY